MHFVSFFVFHRLFVKYFILYLIHKSPILQLFKIRILDEHKLSI